MTIDCQLHQAYLGYLSELNKKSGAHWRWGVLIQGWDIPPTTMAHSTVTWCSESTCRQINQQLFWFISIHPEGNRTWDGLFLRVQNKQSVVEHYTEALLELLLGTTRNHIGITILTALQANKRRTKLSTCGFLGVHTWIKSMAGMKSNTLQFAVCVINGRRKPLRMVIGL